MASATDNIDGIVAITSDAPATFPIGVTTVTWTSSDSAGNTATATQNIYVSYSSTVGGGSGGTTTPPPAGGGATVTSEAVYWHHNDHLGTPQALTDINGTKVWEMSQTPFGIVTVNEDPDGDGIKVTSNFRFPGQYYDAETGLNYNYFRTFDPALGRYTQSDPIGLYAGMNTFTYVGANPVNGIDPLGLRIQALGTTEEINLINSWLDTFAKMPCDSEVRKRYQAIKDSPILFTINFSADMWRAGQYKNYHVELATQLRNPNQKTFHYSNGQLFGRETAYFGGPDTLAHELLGHGFDALNGDFVSSEPPAIKIANEIRRLSGQLERGLND